MNETDKFICDICGKEFKSRKSLSSHRFHHDFSNRVGKCPHCGMEMNLNSLPGHITNCKSNPNYSHTREVNGFLNGNSWKGKHLSEESKKKISDSMKIAHKEGRAWNIGMSRWNNEPSYPEKFFSEVINNEFEDKNFKREYPLGKYSLDFAWIDKKRAIEIDGDQHIRFEDYKERDKRKDEFAKENGWEIMRIRWRDFCNNTKEFIIKAKHFIDS